MASSVACARLLRDVSSSLTSGDQSQSVSDIVLPLVRQAFAASVASLVRFRAPSTLQLAGADGLPEEPEWAFLWEEFEVTAGVPEAEAARTGQPVWLADIHAVPGRYPAWPTRSSSRGVCAVPLQSAGRLLGVLGLAWPQVHEFGPAERDTLMTVAGMVGAAYSLDHQRSRRRLGVVDSETRRTDVHLAQLVRTADTAVPRTVGTVAAHGAPTLSWIVESPDDVALGVACEGVLALARRQQLPPGVAARNVADLCEEMGGEAVGIVVQVGPEADWVAVAGINDCLVLSAPVHPGPEVTAFSGAPTAADEHVIVPDGEGASVLALLLARGSPRDRASTLVPLARTEFERRRGASAEDVLSRVSERLGEHGVDGGLLGALALVVAPRGGLVTLRRTLPARPLAVPLARRFALAALGPEPDPDPDLAFRLALTVDELVANAIRHCHTDVTIAVESRDNSVRIEVSDDDDRVPEELDGGPHALTGRGSEQAQRPVADEEEPLLESGRGFMLLRAVADDWGVRPLPAGGKSVWVELRRSG